MDGVFTAPDEDGAIRFVTVRFRQEMKSFSGLNLIDATGKKLGSLKLAGDDTTYKIWEGEFAEGATVQLQKGVPTPLGIQAVLKKDGSISAELVDTAEFTLQVQGVQTGASRQLIPTSTHFPYHQTSVARITMVNNADAAVGTLKEGTMRKVASFTFSGAVATGYHAHIQGLVFDVQSNGVALSNWKVGTGADILQASCSVNSSNTSSVDCASIPESLQTVGPWLRTLSLYANVSVNAGATDPYVRISLSEPGAVGKAGSVNWTDGSGRFNWIESPTPIAVGTRWTVTK